MLQDGLVSLTSTNLLCGVYHEITHFKNENTVCYVQCLYWMFSVRGGVGGGSGLQKRPTLSELECREKSKNVSARTELAASE